MLDDRGVHIPTYILGPYNEGSSINITCVSIGGNLPVCNRKQSVICYENPFYFAQLTTLEAGKEEKEEVSVAGRLILMLSPINRVPPEFFGEY